MLPNKKNVLWVRKYRFTAFTESILGKSFPYKKHRRAKYEILNIARRRRLNIVILDSFRRATNGFLNIARRRTKRNFPLRLIWFIMEYRDIRLIYMT